jgi:hypothetical protein
MLKTIMVLFTLAAVGLVQPALARGGGGHGFGGGGFHGGGFHGGGFHRGFVGFGFGPYAYYDGYYPYDYGDCYIVRHRVMTRYGWRVRPVQVCG